MVSAHAASPFVARTPSSTSLAGHAAPGLGTGATARPATATVGPWVPLSVPSSWRTSGWRLSAPTRSPLRRARAALRRCMHDAGWVLEAAALHPGGQVFHKPGGDASAIHGLAIHLRDCIVCVPLILVFHEGDGSALGHFDADDATE